MANTQLARQPLPWAYYYFFWLIEPSLTLSGAAYAIFRPEQYGQDYIPPLLEISTNSIGNTIRGRMVIGGLGSCFFLLALISLSLFPIFKQMPVVNQEKLVKGLLVPLAIADRKLIHPNIALTLIPMPASHLWNPSEWTTVMFGNVWITVFLFAVRSSYFLGIGRGRTPQKAGGKSK